MGGPSILHVHEVGVVLGLLLICEGGVVAKAIVTDLKMKLNRTDWQLFEAVHFFFKLQSVLFILCASIALMLLHNLGCC